MSATMNRSHNVLYARLVPGGNVLQSSPKGFFEADACPVTGDHDRPFNDRRFHRLFSIPVRLCAAVRPTLRAALGFKPIYRRLVVPPQSATARHERGQCCLCFLRRMTAVFFFVEGGHFLLCADERRPHRIPTTICPVQKSVAVRLHQ